MLCVLNLATLSAGQRSCFPFERLFSKGEAAKSTNLFLYIDMLQFDFPIVFAEPVCLALPQDPRLDLTTSLMSSSGTSRPTSNNNNILDASCTSNSPAEGTFKRLQSLRRRCRTGEPCREQTPSVGPKSAHRSMGSRVEARRPVER